MFWKKKPRSLCPSCGASGVTEELRDVRFPYGEEGPEQVILTIEQVPVLVCRDPACRMTFTDYRYERLQTKRVKEWRAQQERHWGFQRFIEVCIVHADRVFVRVSWDERVSALSLQVGSWALIINFWKSMQDRIKREGT